MPGQAKNPGFADAAQRQPRLESPDQPRWHNHLLEVRPESRAQKVWLYKQLFHAVKELVLISSPAHSHPLPLAGTRTAFVIWTVGGKRNLGQRCASAAVLRRHW